MRRGANTALWRLISYLLIPCTALLVPTEWLESHPAPCLYRLVFHRSCLGCGMARALSSAAHGRFRRSLQHNHLVVVVLPLGVLVWLRGLHAAYRDYREPKL